MLRFILFMPTFIVSVLGFSQKKNGKVSVDKYLVNLRNNMQKSLETLNAQDLENNVSNKANYIATKYKNIGLQALFDSLGFIQPFSIDLGKEIKPACNLKINGIQLQPGIDYWPFPFCPNGSFAGTAVWDGTETKRLFLYDLKPEIEKNKQETRDNLLKHIKIKAAESANQKMLALIVYNSAEMDDGLTFFPKDTAEPAAIPIIYFTKNGIRKLKEESTIANAIDAQIVIGEKIVNGTNTVAFLNNSSSNTIIIASPINNNMGNAIIFELAKTLKEICHPAKKNTTGFIATDYTNNNYLFVNFNDQLPDNVGSNYLLNHLPFDAAKINYTVTIGIGGSLKNTADFLSVTGTNSSDTWNYILQKNNTPHITKADSSLMLPINPSSFSKNNIPNIFLFNQSVETEPNNKTIVNQKDVNAIQYILQLIGIANKYGKLPFNEKDK